MLTMYSRNLKEIPSNLCLIELRRQEGVFLLIFKIPFSIDYSIYKKILKSCESRFKILYIREEESSSEN